MPIDKRQLIFNPVLPAQPQFTANEQLDLTPNWLPSAEDEPLFPAQPSIPQRALIRGTENLKGGTADMLRLGADALGMDSAAQYLDEVQRGSLRRAQKFPATIGSLQDVNSVGDFGEFLLNRVPESFPYLMTTIGGGAFGRGLARMTPAARTAATAGSAATQAQKLAAAKALNRGTALGAWAGITAPETGFTYRELEEATGEKRPWLALGAGAAKGALDVYSTGKALQTFMPKGGSSVRRALTDLGLTGLREGVTETAQEGIDIGAVRYATDNKNPLSYEELMRLADSGVIGAAGGITMGAAGTATNYALNKMGGQDRLTTINQAFRDSLRKRFGDEQLQTLAYSRGFTDIDEFLDSEMQTRMPKYGDNIYDIDEDIYSADEDALDVAEYDALTVTEPTAYGPSTFNKFGRPWSSPALREQGGVVSPEDAVAKRLRKTTLADPLVEIEVEQMRKEGATDDEINAYIENVSPYSRVSYIERLRERARDEYLDFDQLVADEAEQLASTSDSLRAVLDKIGPHEFVSQFEFIRRKPVAETFDDARMNPFTDEELKGKGDTKEARQSSAIIRRHTYDEETGEKGARAGELLAKTQDESGKERQIAISLHNLISAQLRRMGESQNKNITDRIAEALYGGMATLMTQAKVTSFDMTALADPANAEVVAYSQGKGEGRRTWTLGELAKSMSTTTAVKDKVLALQASQAKARVAKLYQKVMKLRAEIQNIPVQMSLIEDQAQLEALQERYLNAKEELQKAEGELRDAYRDLAEYKRQQAEESEDPLGEYEALETKHEELTAAIEELERKAEGLAVRSPDSTFAGEAETVRGELIELRKEQQRVEYALRDLQGVIDKMAFDPADIVQEVKDDTAVEAIDEPPIERGYDQTATPKKEYFFNFDMKDERRFGDENRASKEYETDMKRRREYLEARLRGAVATMEELKGKAEASKTDERVLKALRREYARVLKQYRDTVDKLHAMGVPALSKTSFEQMREIDAAESLPLTDIDTVDWEADPGYIELAAAAKDIASKIGIDVRVLTPSEAYTASMEYDPKVAPGIVSGSTYGFHVPPTLAEWLYDYLPNSRGKYLIYVNPRTMGKQRSTTIAHEVGHAAYWQFRDKLMAKKAVDEIMKEYYSDVAKGLQYGSPQKFFAQRPNLIMAMVRKGRYTNEFTRSAHAWEYYGYVAQFEEWFADRVRNRLVNPAPPKSSWERLADSFIKLLRKMVRAKVAPYNTVEDFIDQILHTTHGEWKQFMSPVQVLNEWKFQMNPNQSPENEATARRLLENVKEFYEKTTGGTLSAADADLLLQMAMLHNTDVVSAAFHKAMYYGVQTLMDPKERQILGRAVSAPHVLRQLGYLLRHSPEAMEQARTDMNSAIAYAYQFWMTGQLDLSNKTNSTLHNLHNMFAEVAGIALDSENADMLFENFTNGNAFLRKQQHGLFAVKKAARDTMLQRAIHDHLAPAWEKIAGSGFGRSLFSAATNRMYATGNPILIQLANQIYAKIGTSYVGQDMLTARTAQIGHFTNEAYKIYGGMNREFGKAVIDILNSGRKFTDAQRDVHSDEFKAMTPEEKAAVNTRRLMTTIYNYMVNNGLKVGYIENYFPWVFDVDYLIEHRREFIDLMSAPNFAEKFQGYTPEDLYTAIVDDVGLADVNIDLEAIGHIPKLSAMNERTLAWVDELATPEQRQKFGEFFSDDLGLTLITYINQAVKRAEYHKRFGGKKLDQILSQAAQYGATKEDLEVAKTFIDAVMGTHGWKTNIWLHKFLGLEPPPVGEVINPKLQRSMGIAMVYQNLRTLSLATLTSLADVVGIAVRTGEFDMAYQAFKAGLREVVHHAAGDESVLVDLAEGLGTVDRHMNAQALNWEYGGVYLVGPERRVNEWFFRFIGLQAWTRATRVMATEGAMRFIRRHIQNPNAHSERFLAELNITPVDVKFHEDGTVRILSNHERHMLRILAELEGREELSEYEAQHLIRTREQTAGTEFEHFTREQAQQEISRDDRMRNAIHRFVDSSILRPNATLRPIWASDPHFMLFFHLKSFMYAFHERILKRLVLEAENGNFAPLLMAGMFIPAMMGSELLRDLIQHTGDGDPLKQDWGWFDHVFYATERSGMLGLGQIALDAGRSVKFGGMGYESFAGPTYEQVEDIIQDGDYDWMKAVPGQNIIRYWGEQ